jgi:DNA-directed RNA polymerase specialized sigma24 family protein
VTVTANHVERKTAQDASATFKAAFQEHWPRVCAVLYRLVGDRDEAEDLALEACGV